MLTIRGTSRRSRLGVKPVSLVSGVLHTNEDGLAQADFSVPQFTGKFA